MFDLRDAQRAAPLGLPPLLRRVEEVKLAAAEFPRQQVVTNQDYYREQRENMNCFGPVKDKQSQEVEDQ